MAASIKTSEDGRTNVGGITAIASATLTRPADTTAYAAAEQIAQTTTAALNKNLVFDVARVDNGTGIITSAVLIDSSAESTKPSIDLLLFHGPVTNAADNAAAAPTDEEMETMLPNGVISFDGPTLFKVGGANGAIPAGNQNIPFKCRNGTKIYGILVVRNAYTPVSAEKFTVNLGVLQD